MTDLKRRSLVAALGAAPFAVPLLAQAQALETKLEVQTNIFARTDQAAIFSESCADRSRRTQVEVLRRPRQRQDRDLQHVLREV